MVYVLRKTLQLLFLAVFVVLAATGRIQVWMAVFLGSVAGALLLGRFYCGWICPINTLLDGVQWVYKKLGIKRRPVPNWLKNPLFRYGMLALFIGILVFTFATGRRIPLLILLSAAGVTLSLFVTPAAWHRYVCPYGTLLSFTGRLALFKLQVDKDTCTNCGVCERACPAEAVKKSGDYHTIKAADCLECLACVKKCPPKAISYRSGT